MRGSIRIQKVLESEKEQGMNRVRVQESGSGGIQEGWGVRAAQEREYEAALSTM